MNGTERPLVERLEIDQLPCWRVRTAAAELLVAQQGAQILSYQRHGERPLIWLSEQAEFKQGQSVRGGVPLCWPWFGDLRRNPQAVQALYQGGQLAPCRRTQAEYPPGRAPAPEPEQPQPGRHAPGHQPGAAQLLRGWRYSPGRGRGPARLPLCRNPERLAAKPAERRTGLCRRDRPHLPGHPVATEHSRPGLATADSAAQQRLRLGGAVDPLGRQGSPLVAVRRRGLARHALRRTRQSAQRHAGARPRCPAPTRPEPVGGTVARLTGPPGLGSPDAIRGGSYGRRRSADCTGAWPYTPMHAPPLALHNRPG